MPAGKSFVHNYVLGILIKIIKGVWSYQSFGHLNLITDQCFFNWQRSQRKKYMLCDTMTTCVLFNLLCPHAYTLINDEIFNI